MLLLPNSFVFSSLVFLVCACVCVPHNYAQRLAPPLDFDGSAESGSGGGGRKPRISGQHKRLTAAWFGEDGKGSVPREEFAAFVRHLRLDIKTVECRLYSRYV